MIAEGRRTQLALVLLWLAFLVRGFYYVQLMPIWEGWDEYAHFAYVQYISASVALPPPDARVSAEISHSLELVPLPWSLQDWAPPNIAHDGFWRLDASERSARIMNLWNVDPALQTVPGKEYLYEGKQPPLFYLLAAPILAVFHDASLPARILLLRFFGIVVASALIPISFLAARHVFGDSSTAIHIPALITSFPGLFITISRISNDSLVIVLFSGITLALLRLRSTSVKSWIVCGLCLGVGLLTKAYFVAAVPAVIFAAIWKCRGSDSTQWRWLRCTTLIATVALSISAWWYIERLFLTKAGLWIDLAPTNQLTLSDLLSHLRGMDWVTPADSAFGSHIWIGAWSFLTIRSWMYDVFLYMFLLAFAGAIIRIGRHSRTVRAYPMALDYVTLGLLYVGFWLALMYHAFVNFVNTSVAATCGWYLHAAVLAESILVVTGCTSVGGQRLGRTLTTGLASLFVLLELYTVHFVLIPYYSGLISHNPGGGLPAFHVESAFKVGLSEISRRILLANPLSNAPAYFAALSLFLFVAQITIMVAPWYSRPLQSAAQARQS